MSCSLIKKDVFADVLKKALKGVVKCVDCLEEILVIFFMGLAVVVIFMAIVHRALSGIDFLWEYLSYVHFSWAQEVCIYSFIWMSKFGAAYGVRTGAHIGVDILVSQARPRFQKILVTIAFLVGIIFTGIIAFLGLRWVMFMISTGQVSPDMLMPMWIVYLCIPLGSGLMCFRFLQVLSSYLNTGFLPGRTGMI